MIIEVHHPSKVTVTTTLQGVRIVIEENGGAVEYRNNEQLTPQGARYEQQWER